MYKNTEKNITHSISLFKDNKTSIISREKGVFQDFFSFQFNKKFELIIFFKKKLESYWEKVKINK